MGGGDGTGIGIVAEYHFGNKAKALIIPEASGYHAEIFVRGGIGYFPAGVGCSDVAESKRCIEGALTALLHTGDVSLDDTRTYERGWIEKYNINNQTPELNSGEQR